MWTYILFFFLGVYFVGIINLICIILLAWKFGIDVFFINEEEPSKEDPLNRSQ